MTTSKIHSDNLTAKVQLKSHDLGLSAALISLNHNLIEVEKSNPKKALFIFHCDEQLDHDVGKYWAGNLMVDARTMFESIKMLKNRLYSD